MIEFLIDRATSLPRGTFVEVTVTSWHVVPIDHEILEDDETEITFDALIEKIGNCSHEHVAVKAVRRDFPEEDHEGSFGVVNGDPSDYRTFRFATEDEQRRASRDRFVTLADVPVKREMRQVRL
jgi:hypothetical protein